MPLHEPAMTYVTQFVGLNEWDSKWKGVKLINPLNPKLPFGYIILCTASAERVRQGEVGEVKFTYFNEGCTSI